MVSTTSVSNTDPAFKTRRLTSAAPGPWKRCLRAPIVITTAWSQRRSHLETFPDARLLTGLCAGREESQRRVVETFAFALILLTFFAELGKLGNSLDSIKSRF